MTHTTKTQIVKNGLFILFTLVLLTSLLGAQDLILNGDQTNNGTIRVRRDIINNTTGTVTVSGTGVVRMDRNVNDHLIRSASGNYPIIFSNLSMTQGRPVTAQVDVTVTNNLTIGDASNPYTNATGFSIGSRTLTIQNTSSYLATSTAPLVFSSGTVAYTASSGSQSVLVANNGTTYGTLNLSGNADMTIPDAPAGVFSVATLSHTGSGSLTVNDSATVTTTASIGTLATVASGKVFDIAGTSGSTIGTITTVDGTLRNSVAQSLGVTTVSGNSGTIENIAGGTFTITTLSANSGTIRNTAAGTLAFTSAAASNGTIANTSTGLLDFASSLNGTGTITNNGGGTVEFGGSLAQNTYNLNSGTTIYNSSSAQNIVGTTYNNLTLNNSAKTLAAATTVNGNLALDASSALNMNNFNASVAGNLVLGNDVTTGSGVLTMTSTTASNVSGSGEVLGAVRRNHSFTAGQDYRFNRADVYMNFASTAAGDITLAMTPSTNPTGLSALRYMARKYDISVATNPGNLSAMQLFYLDGTEEQGSANETRIGIQQRVSGSWEKIYSTGYTRSSGSGLVTISGLSGVSIASATELAMVQVSLRAVAGADWGTATTWDENLVPIADDDITINSYAVSVSSGAQVAASVDLQGTATLTVSGGSLALGDYLNISGGAGLSLTGGSLTATDSVVNACDISVASGQSLTTALLANNSGSNTVTFAGNAVLDSLHNDGGTISFNGNATSITRAIRNVSGAAINIGGTTSMLTASAGTFESIGNLTINGGTLNVGNSSFASNLTMTTPSELTLSTGTSYLNVYGNLELGTGSKLSNSGEITIGE